MTLQQRYDAVMAYFQQAMPDPKTELDYDGSPVTIDGTPVTILEWIAAQKRA